MTIGKAPSPTSMNSFIFRRPFLLCALLLSTGLCRTAQAASDSSAPNSTLKPDNSGPVVTATLSSAIPNHSNGGLVLPGDTITFTATVANAGPGSANNLILVPALDPNLTLVAGATTISPYTIDESVGVVPGVQSLITLTGVDPDNVNLGFTILTQPTHGTLGGISVLTSTTAQVAYTANAGYFGPDSFTFMVNDNLASANEAGVVSITSAAALNPPTNVVVTAGNGQATLTFTASTSSGITGYTATSSPGGITANSVGTATTITIPGLTNGVSYTFTVTATNGVSISAASAVSVAAIPAAPAGQPTGVTGVPGNGQVTLSFTAPISNGGSAITSYTATSSPGGFTGISAGTNPSAIVSGLTNGTAYTFTVTANNSAGAGFASAASAAIIPCTVPGAPTGVVATGADTAANLTFAAPASNGGSAITSYTATASPGGITASSAGTAAAIQVTGLIDGIAYTFTVVANNAAGASAPSVASNSVIPGAVPSAPTGVTGVAGNQQVSLSFSPGSYSGGSATTVFTATSSPGGKIGTSSGGTPSVIVSGLTNGTAYTFTVTATNGTGTSLASAASAAVTPATIPDAPTNVVATAGTNLVAVNFTVPDTNGGSPIINYTATASAGGTIAGTGTSVGSNPAVSITGLIPGTFYTVTVVANNAIGAGLTSSSSNAVTPNASMLRAGSVSVDAAIAKNVVRLDEGQLAAVVVEARNRWQAAGLTAAQIKILDTVSVTIADLPRGELGEAAHGAIKINAIADGRGWRALSQRASGQMDLLTAVMHEMGHTLGLPDTYADQDRTSIMYGVLNAGERRTPRFNQAAGVTPDASAGADYLLAPNDVVPTAVVIGNLPPGKSVTVMFSATVANPLAPSVALLSTQATAVGGNFASVATNVVTQTPISFAGVPTSVFAVAGNTSASVFFAAPANTGAGAITGYTVTASPGGITAFSVGATTSVVVSGLSNGTSYTFTVTATNAQSTSVPSAPSNAVTPFASGAGLTAQTITFPTATGAIIGQPITLAASSTSNYNITYVLVSGPATLSGNQLTITGTAAVVVQAFQYGDLTYSAATPVTQTFTATPPPPPVLQTQTITFGGFPNVTTKAAPITLAATASSGLAVTYSITGPAILSGSTVTLTGASGTVSITARQAGNTTYAAAPPVTVSFTVSTPVALAFFGTITGVSNSSYVGNLNPDAAISGNIAATVNAANTAGTMIGTIGNSGFVVNLTINSSGAFTGTTTAIAAPGSNVTGTLTFAGQLSGSVLTGTIAQLGATFSITADAVVGAAAGSSTAISGYYSASALASSSVKAYTIVGTTGEDLVVAVTPISVSSGTGTVSGNTFTAQTSAGVTVTGTVNPTTTTVSGTINTGTGASNLAGVSGATAATNRLINVSFLGNVSASSSMTSGFVIGGTGSINMLVRGDGPALAAFGSTTYLAQPKLQLFSATGTVLATNTGWGGSATLSAIFVQTGAFPLAVGSADAAMLMALSQGSYSAQITNAGTTAGGGALLEVYDADASPGTETQRLVNISNLGLVGPSGSVTAGFIISGNSPEKVLIRGVGPSLSSFGVSPLLADPQLTVYTSSQVVVAQNNDWGTPIAVTTGQTTAAASDITAADAAAGAFPLVVGSKDAAIIITLAPGNYSAQVTGVAGATGMALVEVYELTP